MRATGATQAAAERFCRGVAVGIAEAAAETGLFMGRVETDTPRGGGFVQVPLSIYPAQTPDPGKKATRCSAWRSGLARPARQPEFFRHGPKLPASAAPGPPRLSPGRFITKGPACLIGYAFVITAVLVGFCWWKGEPARWRWGDD